MYINTNRGSPPLRLFSKIIRRDRVLSKAKDLHRPHELNYMHLMNEGFHLADSGYSKGVLRTGNGIKPCSNFF
jgi:hypothetical protein